MRGDAATLLVTFWIMRKTWHAEWWHDLPVCRGPKPCSSQVTTASAAEHWRLPWVPHMQCAVHNQTELRAHLVVDDGARRQHCDVGACRQGSTRCCC